MAGAICSKKQRKPCIGEYANAKTDEARGVEERGCGFGRAKSAFPVAAMRSSGRSAPDLLPQESVSSPRERLLFDFGWRFHLGHACDPARDFGFDGDGVFSKSGDLFEPCRETFDDSKWRALDLPHDWAVELEFEDDPGVLNHGFKPLDRNYPATSIGWYRRVFEIPASDLGSGSRLSLTACIAIAS